MTDGAKTPSGRSTSRPVHSGSSRNFRTSRIRCSQPSADHPRGGPDGHRILRWSAAGHALQRRTVRPGNVLDSTGFLNGRQTPFVTGLKTAIGVLQIDSDNDGADGRHEDRDEDDDAEYLVLQNASTGPFFNGPGLVLGVAETDRPPTVLANCLTRPTAIDAGPTTHALRNGFWRGTSSRFLYHGDRRPHAQPWPIGEFQGLLGHGWRSASWVAAGRGPLWIRTPFVLGGWKADDRRRRALFRATAAGSVVTQMVARGREYPPASCRPR